MRLDVVTTPRKRPLQERSQATVEAILIAAARVMVKDGFDGASTNQIARVAGVSIGSLYQYFPNKESLAMALLRRHVEMMVREVGEGLELFGTVPLRQAMRAMVVRLAQAHARQPELHRLLMEQVPRNAKQTQVCDIKTRMADFSFEALRRCGDQVRPVNRELAAVLISQTLDAVTFGAVAHDPERLHDDEFFDEVTELIVRYLEV